MYFLYAKTKLNYQINSSQNLLTTGSSLFQFYFSGKFKLLENFLRIQTYIFEILVFLKEFPF